MSTDVSRSFKPINVSSEGTCEIENIKYPAVGFGTFPFKDDLCFKALKCALEAGYGIIDTATFYENFGPISNALKKNDRNHFYIISKVWPHSHSSQLLEQDLKMTLERLQINDLDAYFLHWPNSKIPIEETLLTLEEFRANKLIRHIGLSNVTLNHVERALEVKVPITWIQNEMNPLYYDPELLKFCKDRKLVMQAWAPLARGRINDDPLMAKLGKKYGKTSSQIAIKWIIQNGCLPLPGSKNPKHIKENINVMDFSLSEEEMNEINKQASIGKRERVTLDMGLGFADEFDYSYADCWPKSSMLETKNDF